MLVFAEEFDSFDATRWTKEHSTYGDGNAELQCYTPQQVSVASGNFQPGDDGTEDQPGPGR